MIKTLTTSPATASGLLALSVGASALVAGTATNAHANVLVYTSGLTTSIAPDGSASNNDVFFDFVSGTSSKDVASTYQYRLNTTSDGATIHTTGASSRVAGDVICGARQYEVGQSISSTNGFDTAVLRISTQTGNDQFAPGESGYLGFEFASSPDTFYGFADITVQNDRTVTLNSFGYETTPGQAIAAGASATVVPEANPLELLLLGAVGMGAYRAAQARKPKAA